MACLALSLCGLTASADLDKKDRYKLFEKAKSKNVLIRTSLARGNGIALPFRDKNNNKFTIVLTAGHVVEDALHNYVLFEKNSDGQLVKNTYRQESDVNVVFGDRIYRAKILATSIVPVYDMAALIIPLDIGAPETDFGDRDLIPGERVYYSYNVTQLIEGMFSGPEKYPDRYSVQKDIVQASVQKGASGSAVYDEDMNIVGFLSATINYTLMVMIPNRLINRFLAENDLLWILGDQKPPLLDEIMKEADVDKKITTELDNFNRL